MNNLQTHADLERAREEQLIIIIALVIGAVIGAVLARGAMFLTRFLNGGCPVC